MTKEFIVKLAKRHRVKAWRIEATFVERDTGRDEPGFYQEKKNPKKF